MSSNPLVHHGLRSGNTEQWERPVSQGRLPRGGPHSGEGQMKSWGALLGGVMACAEALGQMTGDS